MELRCILIIIETLKLISYIDLNTGKYSLENKPVNDINVLNSRHKVLLKFTFVKCLSIKPKASNQFWTFKTSTVMQIKALTNTNVRFSLNKLLNSSWLFLFFLFLFLYFLHLKTLAFIFFLKRRSQKHYSICSPQSFILSYFLFHVYIFVHLNDFQ